MKKEFQPGDFARFPNEQIPRILDILRVNGYKLWGNDAVYQETHDIIFVDTSGDIMGYWSREPECKTELTPHDFMTIALRLEEGMGILANQSTSEQRRHIIAELEAIGINQHSTLSVRYEKNVFEDSFYFDGTMFISTRVDGNITTPIHPSDWLRRLCVEPIEKTLEQHVDEYDAGRMVSALELDADGNVSITEILFNPNMPWEFSDNHSNWYSGDEHHYVGLNKEGYHVIQLKSETDEYEHAVYVRNFVSEPEFNASMLEVGEWMVVDDSDIEWVKIGNRMYRPLTNAGVICIENGEVVTLTDAYSIKGRKVRVEIKVTSI